MKKILFFLLLLTLIIFGSGCYNSNEGDLYINQIPILKVNVGDPISLKNIDYDENTNILEEKFNSVFAKTPGEIIVNSPKGKYHIVVLGGEPEITATAKQSLTINEQTQIQTVVYPLLSEQTVSFSSTDTNVITVNNNGVVTAVSEGVARVIIESTSLNVTKELTFIVIGEDELYYSTIINTIINNSVDDDNTLTSGLLNGVYNYNISSLIGVNSYYDRNSGISSPVFGSGIIYKMNIHYLDGEIKENVTTITAENNIKEFEYYVITNRHLVYNANKVKIFIGNEYDEIEADVLASDTKIDLSVLKFKSKFYFPIANIGDSDDIEKGEFILSIGNGISKDHYRSSTFGVISATKRYIKTDTDNDNVSDWDSEFIQHDASINEGDSGGAIMNLDGEIIGINSTKISSLKYNNMSFAIPINLVMEIVEQLEKGIVPQRPLLGVSILDLLMFSEDPDYYEQLYPEIEVPEGLKYGFYVTEINKGSVSERAGVQIGDIIVGFNGVELKYSYQLRLELGKFLIGSNQVAKMVVIRNGEYITLDVIF